MVIVFFGTPQFAVPSLDRLITSQHQVAAVVTQPDRPRGRGQKVTDAPVKAFARAHNVPLYQPGTLRDPAVVDWLQRWKPDLGVVAAYGKIIPETLLQVPRLGMINVHASLLPKYRGAAPVHRAIINGERETGVTIMQVAKALDAGAMLAKAARPIGSDETSEVLERALAEDGARLLIDVIDRVETGEVRPEPQDDSASTYAARLTKEEGLIDWSLLPQQIHNRVRGLYPWPHAYSFLDGARLIVLKTAVRPDTTNSLPGITTDEPGTIVDVTRNAVDVATGAGGRIALLELQPEGRRPMPAREFLAGREVRRGMRLDSGPS